MRSHGVGALRDIGGGIFVASSGAFAIGRHVNALAAAEEDLLEDVSVLTLSMGPANRPIRSVNGDVNNRGDGRVHHATGYPRVHSHGRRAPTRQRLILEMMAILAKKEVSTTNFLCNR